MRRLCVAGFSIFFVWGTCYAQLKSSQEISGAERTRQLQEQEKELREKIEKKKGVPEVEGETLGQGVAAAGEEKVFVSSIRVTGVTFIPSDSVNSIVAAYQGKELTLADLQKVAGLITEAYRSRGYITSRAYLPPQKIENGVLEIRVIEGMTGDIEVRGNRYFKTGLLKKKIALKKGAPFDYEALRKGLVKINRHQDRFARAILAQGREPGTTDVVLEVKDRLPVHAGFDWDNFASRYIEKDRATFRLNHNNLLGLDDRLTFQYQLSQAGRYYLKAGRYLLPLNDTMQAGFYASHSRVKLGQDYEDLDARGKSSMYGVFFNASLLEKEKWSLAFNVGFDYKDITNYQQQVVSSRDRMRVARVGLESDASDDIGRTILTAETAFGIPDIMGGLAEQDPKASRSGSGGEFVKETINFLRLQQMPFASQLLWKNQLQLTPDILAAVEQFQLGGVSNVRGYPPAEAVGDRGFASTFEWAFPPYLVSKELKVPFSKATFYEAFRVVMFYDWGHTRLKRPAAGEEKHKTLRSAGTGLRFNLPEDFSLRFDLAWPLDNTPSDSDHLHPWLQISKDF